MSIWHPESFVEKKWPEPTRWVHRTLKRSALTKCPFLHAIWATYSKVRAHECGTFEVCQTVHMYVWKMYVKFHGLILTLSGPLGGCDRASDPANKLLAIWYQITMCDCETTFTQYGIFDAWHWSHAWVEDAPKVLRHTFISKWTVGAVTERLTRLTNASKC